MLAEMNEVEHIPRGYLGIISWLFSRKFHTGPKIRLKWIFSIILILFGIIFYYIGTLPIYQLPKLNTNSKIKNNNLQFNGRNAYDDLKKFVQFGPKPVGSPNNEKSTFKFILNQIQTIQRQIIKNKFDKYYNLEISTQNASGSFVLDEIHIAYKGIQNIVAKLSSKQYPAINDSILLNSHFDTAVGSPGGGDDGSMVVVMLEVLRAFSRTRTKIYNPIVFLFNGGEEYNLEASHAFITQHKWSNDIRAFINLDAAGSSGKEILFRLTKKHLWLFRYYKNYAKYPFASTLVEELFPRVPSDTDYMIFNTYGGIPGLDLAYWYNGYVYHTSSDNIDPVAPEALQNTGENILSIISGLTNAKEINNPDDYLENDHVVFFDIFGKVLVSYSSYNSLLINVAFSIISIGILIYIIFSFRRNALSEFPTRSILCHFRRIFMVQGITLLCGCAFCIFLAFVLAKIEFTYRWYSNVWLIFGMYYCPSLFVWTIIPSFFLKFHAKKSIPYGNRIQIFLHSHCIILCICNIILSYKYRSTYLLTIVILFYMIPTIINFAASLHHKRLLWTIPIIIFQVPSFMYISYVVHFILLSLVPMTARGLVMYGHPEYYIALVVLAFGILLSGFLALMFLACKNSTKTSCIFLVTFIIFMGIALSPIGFPFKTKVTPSRFEVTHVKRIIYNVNSTVKSTNVGYVFTARDNFSLKHIKSKLSAQKPISIYDSCKEQFCPSPLTGYTSDNIEKKPNVKTFWIPATDDLKLNKMPELKLISKNSIALNMTRLKFKLNGIHLMEFYIHPMRNKKLVSWSLDDEINPTKYYHEIKFITGDADPNFEFFFDFEGIQNDDLNVIIVGIGQYNHHENYFSKEYKNFLKSFPQWGFVQSWMQTYQYWIF